MSEHPHDKAHGAPGPFDQEIDVRSIARIGIWLAVVTVVSFAISVGFYYWLAAGEKRLDAQPSPIEEAREARVPPGPQLQRAPAQALDAFRAGEEKRLHGWGWVDRPAGVAHVPIERAIEEVAGQGRLPDFQAPAPPPAPAEEAP